jgi:catechol 2,3-dioxygenase-like lactoylglutathione lyase family enzyme
MSSAAQRPEDLRFLSAVLLVSRQPERMVAFYRDLLGLPLVEERHDDCQPHWGCELGDVHFAIHPVEDYPEDPAVGTGAVKLALMVFGLADFVAGLQASGVEPSYPPRPLGAGSLVTAIRDPDGNLVELTELGASWLAHLKAGRAQGNDLVGEWSRRIEAAGRG